MEKNNHSQLYTFFEAETDEEREKIDELVRKAAKKNRVLVVENNILTVKEKK